MALYIITTRVDAANPASVQKKLRDAFKVPEGAQHTVEKIKTSESRAARLAEADSLKDQAKEIVDELMSEMEEWYDSIPENLKEGDKANAVTEAKEALESLSGDLDNLTFDIDFPGMF